MAHLFEIDDAHDLTNDLFMLTLAAQLDEAAARVLTKDTSATWSSCSDHPRAIVGRDACVSGEFPDHTISVGLASSGIDVIHMDVLPTPATAYLTATQDTELGVIISAPHDPSPGNGIKFITRGGYKLADVAENEVGAPLGKVNDHPIGADVGRVIKGETVADQNYANHLVGSVATDLSDLRIVVDASNSVVSIVDPTTLRATGAEVTIISASPDDLNINDSCGSTYPEQLQNYVTAIGTDTGVAYDGGADHHLAVNVDGQLVDGDQIMGMLTIGVKADGTPSSDTLVVTVMSNLSLILAMCEHGIRTVQAGVSDRYMLERVFQDGHTLGSEQSGHVIDTVHVTIGGGVLTSLHAATRVKRTGKTLAELVGAIIHLPQTLTSVRNIDKDAASINRVVQDAMAPAEEDLGKTGRVLPRPSNTEPLMRAMVEIATQEETDRVVHSLAGIVKNDPSL